jgi:hypothetical protein
MWHPGRLPLPWRLDVSYAAIGDARGRQAYGGNVPEADIGTGLPGFQEGAAQRVSSPTAEGRPVERLVGPALRSCIAEALLAGSEQR